MVGTPGAIRAVPVTAGAAGQGITYPLGYNAQGRLNLSFGATSVNESLMSILRTNEGERVMQIDYGSGGYIFEPFDPHRLSEKLLHDIALHEPRAAVISLDVSPGQTSLEVYVTVKYRVIGESTPQTLTAPFFVGPVSTSASGT